MKIVIYGINYAPELTGIGKYTAEMAEWLGSAGHDVRVITAPPYYPKWEVYEGFNKFLYSKEKIRNVLVWRCPIYVPSHPTGFRRIIHLASFAISSVPLLIKHIFWNPAVILCIEPPLVCAPGALGFATLVKAKTWLHIQDYEVDAALELGLLPAELNGLLKKFECWLLRRFDVVSTISRSMVNKLSIKGVENSRQKLLPNWSNLDIVTLNRNDGVAFRAKHRISNLDYLVLYSGNMGEKQGLEMIIQAARLVAHKGRIHFLLCGDGSQRVKLETMAKDMNLTNMSFMPLQPLGEFSKLLNAADVHLVIQKKGTADMVMPSKVSNIIAAGGVSLITADSDSELGLLLLNNPFLGVRVEPENVTEFVSALVRMAESSVRIDRPRIRSFALENFEYKEIMITMEQDLLALDAIS